MVGATIHRDVTQTALAREVDPGHHRGHGPPWTAPAHIGDRTRPMSTESDFPAAGLRPDQLNTMDLTISTIGNIGPGIDFYFGFGVIVATAGLGAPLTIVAAAVAVALLGVTVTAFTRAEPSAGSFITYVESAFGRTAGTAIAQLVAIGYTVAMAGVITMAGGFIAMALAAATGVHIPWVLLTVVIALAALALMVGGVKPSTRTVGVAVGVQVLVMLVVCVLAMVENASHLTLAPFRWSSVTGGLAGLSAGFPLALYMFIGWENALPLAEEAQDPRRSIPRSLFISLAITTVLFVLFSYATIVGSKGQVGSIGRSSIPFLTVASTVLGPFGWMAWVAGIVSIVATLLAGTTSQARMLFDGGRERMLPSRLGTVHPATGTPAAALITVIASGLALIGIWGVSHLLGVGTGHMDPVGLYAECSTFGTIIILVVYAATTVSLPVFIRRHHAEQFSPVRHVVVPLLGLVALMVPFFELFAPGQPAPYDVFPYLALLVIAAVGVLATVVTRRTRSSTRP